MLRYVCIDELPAGAIACGCLFVFTVRKLNQMRDIFKHADSFSAQYTKLRVIKTAQTKVAAQLGQFGCVGGVAAAPSVVAGRSVTTPPLVEANDDMLQSLALSHYAANVVEVCSLGGLLQTYRLFVFSPQQHLVP